MIGKKVLQTTANDSVETARRADIHFRTVVFGRRRCTSEGPKAIVAQNSCAGPRNVVSRVRYCIVLPRHHVHTKHGVIALPGADEGLGDADVDA